MGGEFYVYILFRPNGIPCYVGKGQGNRWLYHEAIGEKHTNKHLARIIKNAGGFVPKVKVREDLREEDALSTEIVLIKAIGREPNGPLVNLTDGGDGVVGFSPTADQIAQHKVRMNDPETVEKCRKNTLGNTINRGRRHTDTARQNMSTAKKGCALTLAHKEAIRKALLNSEAKAAYTKRSIGVKRPPYPPVSDKARLALSISHKGNKHSAETREKMRVAQLRRWARRSEISPCP